MSEQSLSVHSCYHPFPYPMGGSKSHGSAVRWYLATIQLIPLTIENVWEAHGNTKFECAWSLKSRLRLAGALSLRDQSLVEKFLQELPHPSIEHYLKNIGYNPSEDNYQYEPWEYADGVHFICNTCGDDPLDDQFKLENSLGLTMWDAQGKQWILNSAGWVPHEGLNA